MKWNTVCYLFLTSFVLSDSLIAQTPWTLKSCLDTAITRNLSIQQSYFSNEISSINLSQARSSLLPNLYLNDSHSLNGGFSLDPYTNQYATQNISSNTLSLNSALVIFNGHILWYTIRQNRLLYQAGLLDMEKLKVDITLSILTAYMQVLMDYEAVEVTKQQVLTSQVQVGQTAKFLQFGKVAALSLLQIQAQLAADELLQVSAENQLKNDKLILLQLMERPMLQEFDIKKLDNIDTLVTDPPSPDDIHLVASGFMPQIKSAKLKTDASFAAVKIAQTLGLPTLTLSGGLKTGYSSIRSNFNTDTTYQLSTIGYVKGDLAQPVTANLPFISSNKQPQPLRDQLKNNFGQYVTLSLSVPILNRYIARNSIAIARVNTKTAQLNEQLATNDLRKRIETVYINQVAAGKKMLAVKAQLDLQSSTYADMEKKYAFGAVGATDFLIEKNNFNKATLSFIQAKYDYAFKTKIINYYLHKPITD